MAAQPAGSRPGEDAKPPRTAGRAAVEQRPSGITLLAVLSFIVAGLLLMGAIGAVAMGNLFTDLVGGEGLPAFFLGAGTIIVALALGSLSILNAVIGWGLWSGHGWAWILTLGFEGLWALTSLLGLLQGEVGSLLPLAIAGAIVWYLLRPWVRRYFGHAT